jgi:hypothetical protein
VTYGCPALEHNGLVTGSLAISEGAHRLSSLVFEACKQLMELLYTKRLEEPFPLRVENVSLLLE